MFFQEGRENPSNTQEPEQTNSVSSTDLNKKPSTSTQNFGKETPNAPEDHEYRSKDLSRNYPRVVVITFPNPSEMTNRIAEEVKSVFPKSQRLDPGGHTMSHLIEICRITYVTDAIIVHEQGGSPNGLTFCHLPDGPTAHFKLLDVVMRSEIGSEGAIPEDNPRVVFNNFNTILGERLKNIFKYLFPAPKEDSKNLVIFGNEQDEYIRIRYLTCNTVGPKIGVAETGPRFVLRLHEYKSATKPTKTQSGDDEGAYQFQRVFQAFMNQSGH